jgi:hypothetical protein
MNSLPLIHHRLFVAAIGNEDRVCRQPGRAEERSVELSGPARALAWEVLDTDKPMPAGATRSLQVSVDPARA